MNIKILVDFETLGSPKRDEKQYKENLETLEKLANIYEMDLFAKDVLFLEKLNIKGKLHIIKEEDIKNKSMLVEDYKRKYDWVLYFKNKTKDIIQDGNIIYCPICLRGDLRQFQDKSFTEHAKNKKYYHDFSNYYMDTLANDTEKEGEFLIALFKKYLQKETGKMLDCCCGVGRHAFIMAQNNFKVTAIDFSKDQIKNAKKIHSHDNINYQIMDVRDFNVDEKDFDMSYCMWTTYNYLSLERDLKKFIKANYLHQKKGGILVLDSKNIPRLEPHRLYHRYREKENFKMDILINKYVDNNIQNSQYLLFINDNLVKKFFFDDEFVRFYTIRELENIIDGYYELVDIYGDFDMNKYDEGKSNRFITVFRRL